MYDIQKMMDALGETGRRTRSQYHLTLGALIDALEGCGDELVAFDIGGSPTQPHSYRGYYSDLAFETGGDVTASRLLDGAKNCLGRTFEGYKGGDFVMVEDTPLWKAAYGCTGRAMMSIAKSDDTWVIHTRDVNL